MYFFFFDEDENKTTEITNVLENDIRDMEFFDGNIRMVWHKQKEEWFFSIVDVVGALTDSVDSTAYWRKLKQRLKSEGNETVTNCHGLKRSYHVYN